MTVESAPDSGDGQPVALRRDRQFQRYWLARAGSQVGGIITIVALPVLVYQHTGSSLWTSLVAAAQGLPYLCFGLIAGVAGDRFDRRRTMVAADVANAALLASVPLAAALGALTAPHVIAVALATETTIVVFAAAEFGALPLLVGRDRIAVAQSTVFGSNAAASLIAPGLAGAALVVAPPASLLAANVATALASALLIRGITRPLWEPAPTRAPAQALYGAVAAGLGFLWRHRLVRIQTMVGAIQALAAGAFVGQIVPWADRALGVPGQDWRIGALFSSWAAGGLLAAVTAPRLIRRHGEPRVTLLLLPTSALGALGCGLAGNWPLAMAAVALWSVGHEMVELNSITLRQKVTPHPLLSRVNTTGRMLAFGVGYPLGAVAGGVVSEFAGPRATLFAAAAVLTLGAVAVWLSPLRAAERP